MILQMILLLTSHFAFATNPCDSGDINKQLSVISELSDFIHRDGDLSRYKDGPQKEILARAMEYTDRYKGCKDFFVKKEKDGAVHLAPQAKAIASSVVDLAKTNPTVRNALYNVDMSDDPNRFQGLRDVCPNFNKMDDTSKTAFWVWFFENLAYHESSCGRSLTAQGVNCKAICIYQLEEDAQLRKIRPPDCQGPASELMKTENCTKCAVAIFAKQMQNHGDIFARDVPKKDKKGKPIYYAQVNSKSVRCELDSKNQPIDPSNQEPNSCKPDPKWQITYWHGLNAPNPRGGKPNKVHDAVRDHLARFSGCQIKQASF